MNFYIIIPAHNEEAFIGLTLNSLVNQTLLPKRIVVVNDHSTDNTKNIVEKFTGKYPWITLLNIKSANTHMPGSKVVKAFYEGLKILDEDYDVICKFDADLSFPENYIEATANLFKESRIGIAGGILQVLKENTWIYENIADKTHLRGPIKAYKKACFLAIDGLKKSIGWDTLDELLAHYNGWHVKTDKTLVVKHLKPTGENYNKASKYLQGEAMYKMRYGFVITLISALKIAYNKKNSTLIIDYLCGYLKAKQKNTAFLVTKTEGKYIRTLRWKGILKKLHLL